MADLALNFILKQFQISLEDVTFQPINQGYINDTFLILNSNKAEYILQQVNTNVFKNIEVLHQNFNRALVKLKDDEYQEISLIKTNDKALFYKHKANCWRLITYINNSDAFNFTKDPIIALEAGKILGKFHNLLRHENHDEYVDIIEKLNHLPSKITEFETALENTSIHRKDSAKFLIEFALKNQTIFNSFYEANLPLRICHNDTKLNNMLFDKTSKKGLCLIDLDTIMKGYFHYDFGDAIRTVVSESNEDEKELDKIKFNIVLFEKFAEGLKPYTSILTPKELKHLPISCALMPFMHGLRALTDYLNGNIYYKVTYKNQNLDRCKSLFEFTRLALLNQEIITKIIKDKFINPSS
jgi:Ser/Thr protein kinase RdoA (MazF antagonist)